MLEAMRRGAKSWVAKGLMLLLIASFAVWGIGDVFSTRGDSTVASVGEETVTVDQFANALQRQRNNLSQQAGRAVSFSDMRTLGIDRRVLDRLIRDAAYAAELERLGLSAPDAAVREAIRANPAFSNADGFSQARYRTTLSRLGFTPAEFEALNREVLGQQIIADALIQAPDALPGAAARVAAWQAERRGVATLTLPLSLADDPGRPGEEALRAYFQENRSAYREPERRSGVVLHVSLDHLAETARSDITTEQIQSAYEARKDDYRTPPTRVIDQLPLTEGKAAVQARRVISGEIGYEALARELGEAPGDLSLGEVRRGELPDSVAKAVFAEQEPGIVGPVEAPAGPVLIRIREVTEAGRVDLGEVRGEIAADLARREAEARAPEIAGRIEDLRAEGRTLEEIASRTEARLVRFEGLARDGTLADGSRAQGVLASSTVREEIFAALDHEEREILETDEGGYFVVLVERIEEAFVPALAEIRDRVVADWRRDARRDALAERARERAGQLSRGETDMATLAGELGLEITRHEPFLRRNPPAGLPGPLVETLFSTEDGGAAVARDAPGGVMVAQVSEIVPPGPDRLAGLTAEIEGRFAELLDRDRQELFGAALRERFEVAVNEDAIDAVFTRLGTGGGG